MPLFLERYIVNPLLCRGDQSSEEGLVRMETVAEDSAHNRGEEAGKQFHDFGVDQRLFDIAEGRCHELVVLDCEHRGVRLISCLHGFDGSTTEILGFCLCQYVLT